MKRAFLLVLAAAMLLALACQDSTNTKATPKPSTSTDSVATNPDRILALEFGAESTRNEVVPTPTPPPIPTPEVFPTPARAEPSEQIVRPDEGTVTAARADGQTIEGVWITFYDCNVEGYCQTTASGVNLQEGGPEEKERFAACDPNYWTLADPANGVAGTKITIVGDPNSYIWECVDTGSAVKGPAHWDVWFYSQAEGEAYLDAIGTTVTIKILP